ncbi:MAG: NifB/NifX family molybdenum-iron cluster-binding protein [Thermoproteota archaeon]|nr:NifB/NifX family molybdenum-iron cluster-binding protein [Thermoproteota archaeon]
MKVAVSATSGSLDAQVDPRLGRCPYFVVVDSETMRFEVVPNVASRAMGGAGIQAAQIIASKGVNVVVTGNAGPNAFQALSSAGINIITGVSGTVREAVEKFKSGQLQKITAPTTPMGFGMGGGYGMGTGRGRGGGRGMGFRRWQATGPMVPQTPVSTPVVPPTPAKMSKEQEIQMLETQMKSVQKQLDQIKKRLDELKK